MHPASAFSLDNSPSVAKPSSALARLIPRIGLVDDVGAPLATHDAAILVAFSQRLQRVDDLHTHIPRSTREHSELAVRNQTRTAKVPDAPKSLRRRRGEVAAGTAQLRGVVAAGEKS